MPRLRLLALFALPEGSLPVRLLYRLAADPLILTGLTMATLGAALITAAILTWGA